LTEQRIVNTKIYCNNSVIVLLPFSDDIIRHFGAHAILNPNQWPDFCPAA